MDMGRNGQRAATGLDPGLLTRPRVARGCSEVTRRFLDVLRPAFFTRRPTKPLSPTAYLDGLRGFAAFLVYWGHHRSLAYEQHPDEGAFDNGYGYGGKYFFACLPVVRMFFSGGGFSVAVFFVISGYVLSARPLSLIHSGDLTKFYESVASGLFRRWARLYIPCFATTFLFATSWHAFGLSTRFPAHKLSYPAEVWSWLVEFKNWSFIFREDGGNFFSYNLHLWSIPVEFRGSVTIYSTLVALSTCSRDARLAAVVGLIFYLLFVVEGSWLSMFLAGMLVCDLNLLAESGELPRYFPTFKRHQKRIFYIMLVISMLFAGVPSSYPASFILKDTPGWSYLSFLLPREMKEFKWFYLFWSATFLVALTPNIPWLKRFFETSFCQYLGRISFAFYLVHGPVLETLGQRLYLAAGWEREEVPDDLASWVNIFPLPMVGPHGMALSFLLPHLVLLPVTFWTAEVATKLFDDPAIRFPRWLYAKAKALRI